MGAVVDVQKPCAVDAGIDLRGRKARMAQQLLYLVQAAPRVDQEAGVRMREERSLASAKLAML